MIPPNDSERTRERMRELGRASGRARRERKEKSRSRTFIDVLRDRVREHPDELVDSLLGTAAGSVVAARVLERAGDFEIEKPPESPAAPGDTPAGISLGDVVSVIYASGQPGLYGLPETAAEFEELLATSPGFEPVPATSGAEGMSSRSRPVRALVNLLRLSARPRRLMTTAMARMGRGEGVEAEST